MTEIERLADVLLDALAPPGTYLDDDWDDDDAIVDGHVKPQAAVRAVLQAMREPAEVQYDALCATNKMWREQTSTTVWRTYIDALLDEKK